MSTIRGSGGHGTGGLELHIAPFQCNASHMEHPLKDMLYFKRQYLVWITLAKGRSSLKQPSENHLDVDNFLPPGSLSLELQLKEEDCSKTNSSSSLLAFAHNIMPYHIIPYHTQPHNILMQKLEMGQGYDIWVHIVLLCNIPLCTLFSSALPKRHRIWEALFFCIFPLIENRKRENTFIFSLNRKQTLDCTWT